MSYAQDRQTLVVGYYEFPPISYTDEQGRSQGSALSYAQHVLNELGYHVEFRALPSARLYKDLISGEVNIWMGALGKTELKSHTLESRHVIDKIRLALYYHPGEAAPSLPHDLRNKKIIAIKGYSYWEKVNNWLNDRNLNTQLVLASSHTSAIAMLLKKRGDFLLSYQEPMTFSKEKLGIISLEIPFLELQQIPFSFIVSKQSQYSQALLQSIDEYLDKSEQFSAKTEKEP